MFGFKCDEKLEFSLAQNFSKQLNLRKITTVVAKA